MPCLLGRQPAHGGGQQRRGSVVGQEASQPGHAHVLLRWQLSLYRNRISSCCRTLSAGMGASRHACMSAALRRAAVQAVSTAVAHAVEFLGDLGDPAVTGAMVYRLTAMLFRPAVTQSG